MSKRIKTNYPGVFYREARRIGGRGKERVYYIVFKKNGKVHEEKVGRQYADAMTPAQAARMRSGRIEGKRLSPKNSERCRRGRDGPRPTNGPLTVSGITTEDSGAITRLYGPTRATTNI